MAANRYTFDTNLYFYSLDPTSPEKHAHAMDLLHALDPERTVVLLQVLGELSNAVRKRKPELAASSRLLVKSIAAQAVPWLAEDLISALEVHETHGLQLWDAVIWATAQRTGCTILFSEDFQHQRTLQDVTFLNPFKLSKEELREVLT